MGSIPIARSKLIFSEIKIRPPADSVARNFEMRHRTGVPRVDCEVGALYTRPVF